MELQATLGETTWAKMKVELNKNLILNPSMIIEVLRLYSVSP